MLRGKSATAYEGAGRVGYELFGMKAYFDYPWKILLMPEPYGTGGGQATNLEEDPGEQVNLGQEHPEILKKLVANWGQYKRKEGVLDVEVKPIPLKQALELKLWAGSSGPPFLFTGRTELLG